MMTAAAYRESLRRLSPRIFVDGRKVESVADDPAFVPGINAVGVAYDFAHVPEHAALMTARQATSGKIVNRNAARQRDLDRPAEQARGGAAGVPRGPAARSAISRTTCSRPVPGDQARRREPRHHLSRPAARLSPSRPGRGPGDRRCDDRRQGRPRQRPGAQVNRDVYLHIAERRTDGIVIRGTKAIVTGAPYMHELL